MPKSVCVVASGLCACSGNTADAAFACALGQTPDFFAPVSSFESPRHGGKLVGVARGFDSRKNTKLSHCGRVLFEAVARALSGLDMSKADQRRVSIFFGTSIGGIFEAENMLAHNYAAPNAPTWGALRYYECSTIALMAAKRFGFCGECATYSTACSSSSLALADACAAIVQGDCDVAVVCGADAISRITVNGFGSLLLLSQGRARPFDAARDGINLGEAGAALVLASDFAAQKISKNPPLAHVSGWGCTADAYHATAPRPDGGGARAAMARALQVAGLDASKIDFVLAHGTGTKGNDSAEFSAMRGLFGAALPPYSSVKRAFGHTLGASGALNAAIVLEAMRRGVLPPNLGFESGGEEIPRPPITEPRRAKIDNALTVSLGFGGNNSAAVLSSRPKFFCEAPLPRVGVYASGAVWPEAGKTEIDAASLLKDVPPLKKRRLAKLQQMALECAAQAFGAAAPAAGPDEIGVCLGTGMGMVAETQRFVSATLLKREAEPIPSAFTNSVHNAAASAVSLKFGLKGLNSAATAKEVSFECALKQALRAVGDGSLRAALVGSCDERSDFADNFLRSCAKFSKARASADFACAYLIGAEGAFDSSRRAFANILGVSISRRYSSAESEKSFVSDFAARSFGGADKVKEALVYCPQNAWHRRFAESVFGSLGVAAAADFAPQSYSASAGAILAAAGRGAGNYLIYTLSSCGLRALTALEVL